MLKKCKHKIQVNKNSNYGGILFILLFFHLFKYALLHVFMDLMKRMLTNALGFCAATYMNSAIKLGTVCACLCLSVMLSLLNLAGVGAWKKKNTGP